MDVLNRRIMVVLEGPVFVVNFVESRNDILCSGFCLGDVIGSAETLS